MRPSRQLGGNRLRIKEFRTKLDDAARKKTGMMEVKTGDMSPRAR